MNKTAISILIALSWNSLAGYNFKSDLVSVQQQLSTDQIFNTKEQLLESLSNQQLREVFRHRQFLSALGANLSQFKHAKGSLLKINQSDNSNKNWHHFDSQKDSLEGVSSLKFYESNPNLKQQEIIVAVIDSGIDVNHEALQGKIWTNNAEIPNNGIDDDNNGHIDDIYGWNFIGAKDGMANFIEDKELQNHYRLVQGDSSKQVIADSYEITRTVKRLKDKGDQLSPQEKENLDKLEAIVISNRKTHLASFQNLKIVKQTYLHNLEILQSAGLQTVSIEEVSNFEVNPMDKDLVMAKIALLDILENNFSIENIEETMEFHKLQTQICYNININIRDEIVKDTKLDPLDRNYGNNNVIGPNADHGTHIAGIIAANGMGGQDAKGVSTNTKIMAIRVTPMGDERDKDIANAIFYAVDNGAKIINLSLGKEVSHNKSLVDKALKYAQEKDILVIHASGNNYMDIDHKPHYPNSKLEDSTVIENWLEISASSMRKSSSIVADFTNYGQNSVDLFAPGVEIFSTISNNQYVSYSGTSMSTAIVSAIAASLWGSYKEASAKDIKEAIIAGARKYEELMVYKPRIGKIKFANLAKNPSIANLYLSMQYLEKKLKPSDQVQ